MSSNFCRNGSYILFTEFVILSFLRIKFKLKSVRLNPSERVYLRVMESQKNNVVQYTTILTK